MCNIITNKLGAALMVHHPSSGSSTSTIVVTYFFTSCLYQCMLSVLNAEISQNPVQTVAFFFVCFFL